VPNDVGMGRPFFRLAKKHSDSWQRFFKLLKRIEIPSDFLDERDDTMPQEQEGLGWVADRTERSG